MRIILILFFLLFQTSSFAGRPNSEIVLYITDAETKDVTPARVEILDHKKREIIPTNSLIVSQECPGNPLPLWFPSFMQGYSYRNYINNPAAGTRQFYIDKPIGISVKPGTYKIRVFKGIEFFHQEREITIGPGEKAQANFKMERMSNLPAKGWFGADDHLHITRKTDKGDPEIMSWMKAEDINVANLLQMGTVQQFKVNKQYGFGDKGKVQDGNYLIIAGQEHPRTHFFGHTMILGAEEPIDEREKYLYFKAFWEKALKYGGAAGYAHWATGPAKRGISVDAPGGLLTFIEVLQMEYANYDTWYELLNLGIPITPTAGTDFPCGPWGVPGRERFYTKIEGKLTRKKWVDAIKQGKTFVTNGPLLEFSVNGKDIGSRIQLEEAQEVLIKGRVQIDPKRDDLKVFELVFAGDAFPLQMKDEGNGVYSFEKKLPVPETSWLAFRVFGDKVGEAKLVEQPFKDWMYRFASLISSGVGSMPRERFAKKREKRPSIAHTAPIYVSVKGSTGFKEKQAKIAKDYHDRLKYVEYRLSDKNVKKVALPLGFLPNADSVDTKTILRSQKDILKEVEKSKKFYKKFLDGHQHPHGEDTHTH